MGLYCLFWKLFKKSEFIKIFTHYQHYGKSFQNVNWQYFNILFGLKTYAIGLRIKIFYVIPKVTNSKLLETENFWKIKIWKFSKLFYKKVILGSFYHELYLKFQLMVSKIWVAIFWNSNTDVKTSFSKILYICDILCICDILYQLRD